MNIPGTYKIQFIIAFLYFHNVRCSMELTLHLNTANPLAEKHPTEQTQVLHVVHTTLLGGVRDTV